MPDPCPNNTAPTYGVLGHPLSQSLSPVLHGWALGLHDLPGRYVVWDTPAEDLSAFMRAMRETPYAGASVTIPHKQAVMKYLDGVTATAETVGAVNTLYWDNGKLMGHNTDLEGFLAPLAGCAVPDRALILGAGGAARAVMAGLASLGVPRVFIAARDSRKAEALAAAFAAPFEEVTVQEWDRRADPLRGQSSAWVVNTTPLGMRGKAEGQSALDPGEFSRAARPDACLAYDLVYNPLRTAFLRQAAEAGWHIRDGLDMFIAQADAQFRLWTGRCMPRSEARALLAGRLAS